MSDDRPLYVSPEDRALLTPLYERAEQQARERWEVFVLGFMAGQTRTMELVRRVLREHRAEHGRTE